MLQLLSVREEEEPNIDEEAWNIDEEETMLDEGFEVDRMLNEGVDDGWSKSMEDVLKLLYVDCKLIHLTTILHIFNLQVVYGWTNESVDELLVLLPYFLPHDFTLPTKQSACKPQICKLGLGYENIHTCEWLCITSQKYCKWD